MWCFILHPKGTSRNATISATRTEVLDVVEAGKLLRRATPPELIGTWTWMNGGVSTIVYLFGYKTGKAGTDMTQKLPKPHDTVLLFGEILLCATQNGQLVSFDNTSFKTFCTDLSGGDEGNGGEDDAEDEDADEDDDDADEEEEEEEAVEEDDVDDDVPEDEEEEEEPLTKIIVKLSKPKKGSKKIAAWYSLDELKPEPYEL